MTEITIHSYYFPLAAENSWWCKRANDAYPLDDPLERGPVCRSFQDRRQSFDVVGDDDDVGSSLRAIESPMDRRGNATTSAVLLEKRN